MAKPLFDNAKPKIAGWAAFAANGVAPSNEHLLKLLPLVELSWRLVQEFDECLWFRTFVTTVETPNLSEAELDDAKTLQKLSLDSLAGILSYFEPVDKLCKNEVGTTFARCPMAIRCDWTFEKALRSIRLRFTEARGLDFQVRAKDKGNADVAELIEVTVKSSQAALAGKDELAKIGVMIDEHVTQVKRTALMHEMDAQATKCRGIIKANLKQTFAKWMTQLVTEKVPVWYKENSLLCIPDVMSKDGLEALKSIAQIGDQSGLDNLKHMAAQLSLKHDLFLVQAFVLLNRVRIAAAKCSAGIAEFPAFDDKADIATLLL